MAFRGSLQELPLPDILQLVAVSGKTGSFKFLGEGTVGKIFLADGRVVHAVVGDLQGEEAVYELAIWPRGDFEFTPGKPAPRRTIDRSSTSLMMEAARRIDEWRLLTSRIPSVDLVPLFVENGTNTAVTLDAREWAVVRKLDERRSIEEIAQALGQSAFETAKTVYGLISSGLVAFNDQRRGLETSRLRQMTAAELREVAQQALRQARSLLAGHSDGDSASLTFPEEDPDPGADSLIAMIREAETAVSRTLGPHRATAFTESLGKFIEHTSAGPQ